MSVQNFICEKKAEIVSLKEKKTSLQNRLKKIESLISSLLEKKDELTGKAKRLKGLKSALAKELLSEVNNDLEKAKKQISAKKEEEAYLRKQIKLLDSQISFIEKQELSNENLARVYIAEECPNMISAFFEYVKKHRKELGLLFRTSFEIKGIYRQYEDRYESYEFLTGKMGIYLKGKESLQEIVCSGNFCVVLFCDYYSNGDYDEWFKNYMKQLTEAILVEIEKEFPYSDDFKLTIKESSFILELV